MHSLEVFQFIKTFHNSKHYLVIAVAGCGVLTSSRGLVAELLSRFQYQLEEESPS